MKLIPSHLAWNEFSKGRILACQAPMPRITQISEIAKKRLRFALVGAQLQFIESWGKDAAIRSSGYEAALQVIPDRVALRDITVDWNFNWLVEYTIYCTADDGSYYDQPAVVTATNVKMNELTDAVYKQAKVKAMKKCNPKHIKDEGWKATILG